MLTKWYALQIKPHKERSVFEQLAELDIHIFYPTMNVKPKNPRSAKQKPYFPGYMFIKADIDLMGRNAFSWIPGTHGLVSFGGIPAIVPEELIQKLRIELEKINVVQSERLDVQCGESVRIVDGPFAGFDAIFERHLAGNERVQVLLAFLSRHPQAVKLDESYIEKVE